MMRQIPHPRSRSNLWRGHHTPIARHGHPTQARGTSFTLAKWLCRAADRIDPARVMDHIIVLDEIVLGEAHLRRILKSYAD